MYKQEWECRACDDDEPCTLIVESTREVTSEPVECPYSVGTADTIRVEWVLREEGT